MSLRELFSWGIGLWLAAGIEAAFGTGFPGPLLLLAIGAGLSSGIAAGVIIGVLAGFCGALLGGHLLLFTVCGIVCGSAASLISRYFSNRNIIVAISTAAIFTGIIASLICTSAGLALTEICKFAAVRGGINALWMFPIYGFVLVLSPHRLHPSKLL